MQYQDDIFGHERVPLLGLWDMSFQGIHVSLRSTALYIVRIQLTPMVGIVLG